MKEGFDYYPYQEKLNRDISLACINHKSIVVQLETGGGKTIIFSGIASRFLEMSKQDVIIFVDSEEIFKQTRRKLFHIFGIDSDTIDSKNKRIKNNTLFGQPRVFVAMVETFSRRTERETFMSQIRNVGLVIVDECHMGNFIKIFEYFPFALRLGFSATPIFSDKKKSLKDYYETIVCGPTTEELISFNTKHPDQAVVQDLCMRWKNNINRQEIEQEELALGYKGKDFNEDLVGKKLSGNRQIQNTIDAYVRNTPGKKMLCFNANVAHSELVTKEMVKYGLNAKHIDGNAGDEYRKEILGSEKGNDGWLAKTPNAILCNVGITTKGFDEPSVEGVILNTLTKSTVKFRQMVGRCVRPFKYPDGHWKTHGFVLDMCDNIIGGKHGQWSQFTDWKFLFENPKMSKPGVAPSKECPQCGWICAASTRICSGLVEDFFEGNGATMKCGYEFPLKVAEENSIEGEMVLLSKNVDVDKIINFPKFHGKKDYYTFHEVVRACAYFARQEIKHDYIERDEFEKIWEVTLEKITEWQRKKGAQIGKGQKIRHSEWFETTGRSDLLKYLRDYGFTVELISEEIVDKDKNSDHHLIFQET